MVINFYFRFVGWQAEKENYIPFLLVISAVTRVIENGPFSFLGHVWVVTRVGILEPGGTRHLEL